MDPVIHFQMGAEDNKRVSEFYSKVFGWEFRQLGPDMGNYLLATSAKADETGASIKPGTINGGFYTKTKPEQGTDIVIQVDDIRATMEKVRAAGGTVIGGMQSPTEPDDMPGVGLFATIIDTEGNQVALMQPIAAMRR